jgi:two-component system, LytTR family, response regulator
MIRCVVIDDEPLARNLLEEYIKKDHDLELVASFSDSYQGLQYLQQQEIDLLFLDIQMPVLTGTSLLKLLHHRPVTILTTAYSEYALDGYDLDVADYLLKPIVFERFIVSVEKAKRRIQSAEPTKIDSKENILFVKDGTKLVKVNLKEVFYIEGLKDYVSIYTKNQKIVSLQRMKNLEQELPKSYFLRIHHSYIIGLEWIQTVHKDYVEINGSSIPIGETYRKSFKEFIDKQKLLGEN